MKKVVILVSGHGSNLQAIIERCHKQNNIEIIAVISDKADAYALARAHRAGIESVVVTAEIDQNREDYDRVLIATIDTYQPDLIVLAGFMRILSRPFVNRYLGKLINIHPSLLPKYKGLHTHQKAIDAKDLLHGATVHFVTPKLDDGPVILQAEVPVFASDDVESLSQRVQIQEHQIYPLVIEWFCAERLLMIDGKAILDGKPIGIETI